jgi:hypothetical protein
MPFVMQKKKGKVKALKENLWLNPKNSSYSDPTLSSFAQAMKKKLLNSKSN